MREKLTVKEVLEPKPIGDKGAVLQEFIAEDGKKYGTFSKSLFPFIKVGAVIDAQVEEEPRGEFINRRIKDIFENGKSVKPQQGFGGNRGKSPEELELSCRSYALSYAKDLVVTSKIEVGDILSKATEFYNWLHSGDKEPKKILGERTYEVDVEPITAEQKKRLKELQEKLPGRMKELIKKFGWEVATVSELSKPQAKHLIEVMEKEGEKK